MIPVRPLRAVASFTAAATVALALPGCKADLSVGPPASVTCATGTCPDGWTCNPKLSMCIWDPVIDREPPTLHDPQVLPTRSRAFQPTVVSFDVSEPLRVPPTVTLPGGLPLALVTPQTGLHYQYSYLPSGFEVEQVPQPVTVVIEDLQANETTAAGGFLVFDFTRPALDLPASSVPADPLALGSTLAVSIRVTEPLGRPPAVHLSNAVAPGGDFEEVGRSGNDWFYRYVTTDAAFVGGAGEVTQAILVDLEDQVGNRAEGLVLGQARFDRRPPALAAPASLSRSYAGAGKDVSISFTVDEELGDLPVVTLDGPGSPVFDIVDPGSTGRRAFVATRHIEEGDGAGAHTPRIAVMDRAGNGSVLEAPELYLNFQTPPPFALAVCPGDGFDPTPCPTDVPSVTRYSANPGFQDFKYSFIPPPEFLTTRSVFHLQEDEAITVTLEPVGAPSITLAWARSFSDPRFPGGSITVENRGECLVSDTAWVCHQGVLAPATGQERQDLVLHVSVTNRAGNSTASGIDLTYDYRKPALAGAAFVSRCDEYAPAKPPERNGNAYWLRPLADMVADGTHCPYNPGCSAGPSGKVQVYVEVDEELGRLLDGELAASVYLRPAGSSATADATLETEPLYVATCTTPSEVKAYLTRDPTLGPGELEIAAQLTDRVGNRSNPIALGRIRPLPVPGAPAAGLGGPIRHVREPWGPAGQASNVNPRHTIQGAAGAVSGDPPSDVLALLVDAGGVTTLAAVAASATGAFNYLLPAYAGTTVWLRQRDPAGSVGPPALVEDVTVVVKAGPAFPLGQQSWWLPARQAPASTTATTTMLPVTSRGEPRLDRIQDGATPEAAGNCAAAFWPERSVVVRFGGRTGETPSSTATVAWEGISWTTLVSPDAPSRRASAAMAYDAARGRLVLFGGRDARPGANPANPTDTWEFGEAGWKQICDSGTCGDITARRGAAAFYDPVLRRVILFGGRGGGTLLADTWSWDGTRWTAYDLPEFPPKRAWPLVATAPDGRTLLASGSDGAETSNPIAEDGVWLWTTLAKGTRGWKPEVPPPDPLSASTLDYRRALLWWDASVGTFLLHRPGENELWRWDDGPSPHFVRAASPSVADDVRAALQASVFASCAAYDPHRRELVRFGGCVSPAATAGAKDSCVAGSVHGDTFTFTGPIAGAPATWRRVDPRTRPPARGEAALAFPTRAVGADVSSGSAYLLGGAAGGSALGDAWRWDGGAWSQDAATPTAPLRGAGLAAWGTSGLLVRTAGIGLAHAGALSSTALLRPGATAWEAACAAASCVDPIPVASVDDPTFAADEQDLVSFMPTTGGSPELLFYRGADAATWRGVLDPLAPSSVAWTPVAPQATDAPTSVRGHRMTTCARVGSADAVILFGGVDAGGRYLPDSFQWDAVLRAWVKVSSPGPTARARHAQLCDPVTGNVVVIGGFDGQDDLADVWEWDGSAWTERQPAERPSARARAAAAVGGPDHGVLFGGVAGGVASDETWVWRGGADARPAHTLGVTLGGIWDSPARLQSIGVSWAGGATGGTQAVNGARLHAWFDGAWRPVGTTSTADATGSGTATWAVSRATDAASLDPFLASSAVALDLAWAPVGVNGAGAAQLRTSWVDVAIRYRACVPSGQRALSGSDCCTPGTLSNGRCP